MNTNTSTETATETPAQTFEARMLEALAQGNNEDAQHWAGLLNDATDAESEARRLEEAARHGRLSDPHNCR